MSTIDNWTITDSFIARCFTDKGTAIVESHESPYRYKYSSYRDGKLLSHGWASTFRQARVYALQGLGHRVYWAEFDDYEAVYVIGDTAIHVSLYMKYDRLYWRWPSTNELRNAADSFLANHRMRRVSRRVDIDTKRSYWDIEPMVIGGEG